MERDGDWEFFYGVGTGWRNFDGDWMGLETPPLAGLRQKKITGEFG